MYPVDRRTLAGHIYQHVRSLRKTGFLLSVSHTTVRRWLLSPERVTYRRDSPKLKLIQGLVVASIECDPLATLSSLRQICFEPWTLGLQRARQGRAFETRIDTQESTLLRPAQRSRKQNITFHRCTESNTVDRRPHRIHRRDVVWPEHGHDVWILETRDQSVHTETECTDDDRDCNCLCKHRRFGSPQDISWKLRHCTIFGIPEGVQACRWDDCSVGQREFPSFPTTWCDASGVRLLFTPPYSPWFNPIEACFSIVKRSYYRGSSVDQAYATLQPWHTVRCSSNGR